MKTQLVLTLASLAFLAAGCSDGDGKSDSPSDAEQRQAVASGMQKALLADLKELHDASADLMAAAPTPTGRGWDETEDADALEAMTEAWLRARTGYERTEGAIAPLFGETDFAIDARYEDFLEENNNAPDTDPFDDDGVTGMHAIERILFAKTTREAVVEAEKAIEGYTPAAWPETAEEAAEFKEKLCARLEQDTASLVEQWGAARPDIDAAYGGLVALMNEQREKIVKAETFEQESRYSDRTMADIRDNLAGTRAAYAVFQSWLKTKANGAEIDAKIQDGFEALEAAYATIDGDAIPEPPATWSATDPSETDLKTPFGKLYTAVFKAIDPNEADSVVTGMTEAATELGLTLETE